MFRAPCSELAIQPMTPTQSACWEADSGEAPFCGSQITHRSSTYRTTAATSGPSSSNGGSSNWAGIIPPDFVSMY
jgi:hypothetical protein